MFQGASPSWKSRRDAAASLSSPRCGAPPITTPASPSTSSSCRPSRAIEALYRSPSPSSAVRKVADPYLGEKNVHLVCHARARKREHTTHTHTQSHSLYSSHEMPLQQYYITVIALSS